MDAQWIVLTAAIPFIVVITGACSDCVSTPWHFLKVAIFTSSVEIKGCAKEAVLFDTRLLALFNCESLQSLPVIPRNVTIDFLQPFAVFGRNWIEYHLVLDQTVSAGMIMYRTLTSGRLWCGTAQKLIIVIGGGFYHFTLGCNGCLQVTWFLFAVVVKWHAVEVSPLKTSLATFLQSGLSNSQLGRLRKRLPMKNWCPGGFGCIATITEFIWNNIPKSEPIYEDHTQVTSLKTYCSSFFHSKSRKCSW